MSIAAFLRTGYRSVSGFFSGDEVERTINELSADPDVAADILPPVERPGAPLELADCATCP